MDELQFGLSQLNNALINGANVVFASNTHRQDRKFTREMFEKQLQASRENWAMMNEYNSPSAQMERLASAGLNPNLVYGSGAVATTSIPPAAATYNGGYSQPPRMEKMAMLGEYLQLRQYQKNIELADAQIAKIGAEANSIEANTRGTNLANEFAADTMEVREALLQGNLNQIVEATAKMAQDMINSTRITESQLKTMSQARQYEVKRYNLSAQEIGARIKQGWANVANGRMQATAAMQNAATNALRVAKANELTDYQIGKLAIDSMNAITSGKGIELDNYSKAFKLQMQQEGVGYSSVYDNLFAPFIATGTSIVEGVPRPLTLDY